jgi:hypothetical protein
VCTQVGLSCKATRDSTNNFGSDCGGKDVCANADADNEDSGKVSQIEEQKVQRVRGTPYVEPGTTVKC